MVDEIISFDHKDKLKIHVSVPMAILDQFKRKKTKRVLGTLLGINYNKGLVYPDHIEITNCFPIPHQELD